MLLKAGSAVLAPRSAKMADDVTAHVADNGQVSLAPEIVTRKTSIKARKGETVASIARRYKLPAGEVASWNNVSASSAFKVGQQIVVFLPVRASGPRTATASHSSHAARKPGPSRPVKRGGTPSRKKR